MKADLGSLNDLPVIWVDLPATVTGRSVIQADPGSRSSWSDSGILFQNPHTSAAEKT